MEGILVIIGCVAVIGGIFYWMRKTADEDQAYLEQNPGAVRTPAPLTFGSIVGAIIVGNIGTAIIGAILWAILIGNARSY